MKLQALPFPPHDRYMDKNESSFIVLPEGVLHEILSDFEDVEIKYPIIFRILNPENGNFTFGCAYEFSAYGAQCFLPRWVFSTLGLTERDAVEISRAQDSIEKGTKITIEPKDKRFWHISNYKESLEVAFSNYSVLQKGDTVSIYVDGRPYEIVVVETEPTNIVEILNCDLEIEFRQTPEDNTLIPHSSSTLDSAEMPETPLSNSSHQVQAQSLISQQEMVDVPNQFAHFVPFTGRGYRLGDKK